MKCIKKLAMRIQLYIYHRQVLHMQLRTNVPDLSKSK